VERHCFFPCTNSVVDVVDEMREICLAPHLAMGSGYDFVLDSTGSRAF